MSDGMPGVLAKGSVLIETERILNDPTLRFHLKAELDKGKSLEMLVTDGKLGFDTLLGQHLVSHLLPDEPPGYWPSIPHKGAIFCEGLRKLIEVAQDGDDSKLGLPIDLYWLCAGHHFQVIVSREPQPVRAKPTQVTGLLLTPGPPGNVHDLPTPVLTDVWVLSNENDAATILRQGSFPVYDPEMGKVRPRKENEKPVQSDTQSPRVKESRLRRAKLSLD